MGFSRNLLWLIFGVIPFFLIFGCGDLEPEMQDTRAVVLKMDFNQRSSSRNSSVSQAEVSSHKTHLILALPSGENLSSNYKNYYSSFAQELMNPLDNKVSLEIPLNTQMKIFAFLFKQDYTMPQLFSGVREVGYYGASQPFSIGTSTNSLSLGITLQSAGTSDDTDPDSDPGTDSGTGTDTAPAAPVISEISSGTYTTSQIFTVSGDSGATIQYSLDGGTTWLAYSAAVTLTNEGSYTITARQRSDAAGNWSVNATYITVVINQATDTTAPTVTFSPANGANGVAISDNITITFSEAVQNVDNSVLTDSNIDSHITLKLNNASGSNISFNATINTEKTVITINPTSNLTNSQAVYVAIGATLEDYTDNPITAANASFTTESSTDSTLIAHYAFEGNLNDNSSYNRHLTEAQGSQITYSDINFQNNISGQAALFNGTNTYAYTNNISNADTDNWTISFWIKPESSYISQWDSVMSTGDTNTTSGGIFQIDYSGNNQLRFNNSVANITMTLDADEWQHFVFTKWYIPNYVYLYNNKLSYYKDGEYIGNQVMVGTSWNKIKIGLNRLGDSYWKGYIDDLRIYTRALTADEVEELFESYE